jgi:hypothetical protein
VFLAFAATVGMIWCWLYISLVFLGSTDVSVEHDVTVSVAIGSAVLIGLAGRRRISRARFAQLCSLLAQANLAFALYALVVRFFDSMGVEPGLMSGDQALIILLALGWDILISGESITNNDSTGFPRLARVSIFMAYIVLVAVLVMLSTASDVINPVTVVSMGNIFESERLVANGLSLFGSGLLILMLTLRLRSFVMDFQQAENSVLPSDERRNLVDLSTAPHETAVGACRGLVRSPKARTDSEHVSDDTIENQAGAASTPPEE